MQSYANSQTTEVNLLDWLTSTQFQPQIEAIRAEPCEKKRKKLKSKLPAIIPGGIFAPTSESRNLQRLTGLICVDIDYKDNTHISNFSELKPQFSKLPQVAYCGISASGNGYFLIIPLMWPKRFLAQFLALENDFANHGIIIDTQCKNINRLRGASFDPAPYINHRAEPYCGVLLPQPPSPKKKKYKNDSNSTIQSKVEACLSNMDSDITAGYEAWFALGCALANEFGENGREYFHAISSFNHDYKLEETNKQFTNCLKYKYKYNIDTFFYYCKLFNITYK